jgi:2-desacetyl-2-hydroxyethyl bacteriochlorophyllide A dehydrogenase
MKAMILRATGDLQMSDVATPSPKAGEVLVRVTHSGICGTDLKIFNGGIAVHHPLIMGHEMIGQVVEGNGSAGHRKGQRIIVDPVLFCGHCFHCRHGQTHLCPDGTLLGRDHDGGFAEYVAAPAGNIYALPEGINHREASLIQVLTTCLHAQRLMPIFPGEAVAVMGLGVTGQLHAQLAKARGAYPVIGITRSSWKRQMAMSLGADLTLAPGEEAREKVMEATDGRGADLVIESVGRLSVLAEAIDLVRFGGRLLGFGIYTEQDATLPFYQLYFKEIAFINARAAKGEDYPACIDLLQRGQLQLEPLVTHTLALAEMGTALDMLATDVPDRMKIILDHS